jgi:hypothetical protein
MPNPNDPSVVPSVSNAANASSGANDDDVKRIELVRVRAAEQRARNIPGYRYMI